MTNVLSVGLWTWDRSTIEWIKINQQLNTPFPGVLIPCLTYPDEISTNDFEFEYTQVCIFNHGET